jgi:transcriptional regulator with XRE-family HTH domain
MRALQHPGAIGCWPTKRWGPSRWSATRIRALMAHGDLSNSALEARVGLAKGAVSRWRSGEYAPRPAHEDALDRIAAEIGFLA